MESLLKMVVELIGSLPLNKIEKEKGELLKQQIKLLEDRCKSEEEKFNRLEAENVAMRQQIESLLQKVALLESDDAFEFRGPLFYKKGEQRPRCPHCKRFLSNYGSRYECSACKWFHQSPPGAPVSGGPGYRELRSSRFGQGNSF